MFLRPLRPSIIGGALILALTAHAEPLRPSFENAVVAGLVAHTLEAWHYEHRLIDDEMSQAWFDNWLDALDPNRMYLLAQDVDRFSDQSTQLDDDVHSQPPDVSVAFELDALYRRRVQERIQAALAMLAGPLPIDQDDTWQPDRTKAPWASNPDELNEAWRKRLRSELIGLMLSDRTRDEALAILRKRYQRMAADVDQQEPDDVMEIWLSALGAAYDPHTEWMKPISKDDFDISMSDKVQGIGARLREEGEYIKVVSLVAGGPAELGHELTPGDRIVAVAQGDEEPVDCIDMRIDRVVRLIRGPKGTEVVLTVLPAGDPDSSPTKDIHIIRDEVDIELASAKGSVRDVDGLKVGVIDVPSFYADVSAGRDAGGQRTTDDMNAILQDFRSKGVQAVVVDLRKNGGGSLNEAVESTGLFLDGGPVVQIRDRQGDITALKDDDPSAAWDGPVVVLTSMFSASASEIFAAALQDHGRALVVGAQATFGKGTVQELADLNQILVRAIGPAATGKGGALKFTTAKFYRVDGGSTQERGVLADVVIPSPYDGIEYRESDLPHAMPWDEIPPARGKRRPLKVDLESLRSLSAERVAADPLFQVMAELSEMREANKDKPVSLSIEKRRAEHTEVAALQKRVGQAEDDEDEDTPSDRPDPVLEEALRVTRDFVQE